MVIKLNKISRKKDFERIFKNGKSFKNGFFALRKIENNLEASRFAFIVSNKVSKRAVVRNKIRRRIREIIKQNINNLGESTDIAIIALSGAEKRNFLETKEQVALLLKNAKLIKE